MWLDWKHNEFVPYCSVAILQLGHTFLYVLRHFPYTGPKSGLIKNILSLTAAVDKLWNKEEEHCMLLSQLTDCNNTHAKYAIIQIYLWQKPEFANTDWKISHTPWYPKSQSPNAQSFPQMNSLKHWNLSRAKHVQTKHVHQPKACFKICRTFQLFLFSSSPNHCQYALSICHRKWVISKSNRWSITSGSPQITESCKHEMTPKPLEVPKISWHWLHQHNQLNRIPIAPSTWKLPLATMWNTFPQIIFLLFQRL